jgi:geranylgeranyl pyrophosphate synthase
MAASSPQPIGLDAFRPRFAAALEQVMAEPIAAAGAIDPVYAELIVEISHLLARSGKRLRPYLMYLSYIGHGGPDDETIVRLSVAMELFHTGLLIHDDLIDRDLIRHGGANIAGVYRAKLAASGTSDARHLADAMALIAGDYCLTLATNLILDADLPASRQVAATRRLQEVGRQVDGGQMLDVLMPTLPPDQCTPERLLNIYRYKTATYSFELPLHVGAILTGAGAGSLEAMSNFAISLGLAFQIVDDLLGTYGSEAQLGKPVLSDLREGKRTLLLLHGLKLASPADRQRLEQLVGNPKAGYRHLAEIRAILESCGARARTEALAALHYTAVSPATKEALKQLATYMIERSV